MLIELSLILGTVQFSQANGIRWAHRIDSRATFDALARIGEVPYRLPHLRFTIDRKDGKIYFYDSKVDRHHRQLANATYLSLDTAEDFFKKNYQSENRRFILGWIGYHEPLKKWAFEFWEGDTISGDQIRSVATKLSKTFYAPVSFKPNSLRQEEQGRGLPLVTANEIHGLRKYEAVNLGRKVGRLRFIENVEEAELRPGDIVVLRETPISLPPVAGIVFARPTTPLSHLNLMARQWRIPAAYIKDGHESLRRFEGKMVVFEARKGEYLLRSASNSEVKAAAIANAKPADTTPVLDLKTRGLAMLSESSATKGSAYGAKAANLARVAQARLTGVVVPKGFTVPFAYYRDFCRANGIDASIDTLINTPRFRTDLSYRREKLKGLRAMFEKGKVAPEFEKKLLVKAQLFGAKGVFVRSSTNAEDLPFFSGAGLYTTVPNVIGNAALVTAIKAVWGSVWNDGAFAAREQAGIPHRKVAMAVLIQEGVNAESAGVMVTANPFNPADRGATYISAKRGLGIKVVEGKRVPEQLIWRPSVSSVRVLTRSAEDSLLTFDANGGVKEVPIDTGRAVLTDEAVRRLGGVGASIQKLFRGVPQDIEWIVIGKQVYIVQSRPFLSGR